MGIVAQTYDMFDKLCNVILSKLAHFENIQYHYSTFQILIASNN